MDRVIFSLLIFALCGAGITAGRDCRYVEPPRFSPIRNITDDDISTCVNMYKDHEIPAIQRAPHTERYRLGDCIKALHACEGKGFGLATLAGEYEARSNGISKNFTLVMEMLRARDGQPGFIKARPDALVIHLRLGDVIERIDTSVEELLQSGGNPHHHCNFQTSIKSVYEYLHDAETVRQNISLIEIVSGSHYGQHEKGAIYERCIAQMLRKAGYMVHLRKSPILPHPDEDFYRMASAKYFIVGVGGFSRIIASLVRLSGGKVVGRTF